MFQYKPAIGRLPLNDNVAAFTFGIKASKGGNDSVALLANTLATVFALHLLIELLGLVSGAHFNPLVTLIVSFKR